MEESKYAGIAGQTNTNKSSHLEQETRALDKESENLSALVNELHTRLELVLRTQPGSVENTGTPEEDLVPAVDKLRRIRYSISNSAYIIKSILSRLEV
jgi:hypothetical protein